MKEFKSIDKALSYLIQEYGIRILSDSKRCVNMLCDIIPDQKSDINLIKYVFECDLINSLISANERNQTAKQQAINYLNHELVHKSKINSSSASEICEIFVKALNWEVEIPNDVEKEKLRKQKSEDRKKKLNNILKWLLNHIKAVAITSVTIVLIFAAFSLLKPWFAHRGKIHFTNPEEVYIGKDYKAVYDELTELGFNNIRTKEVKDISETPSPNEDKIIDIKFNNDEEWLEKDTLIIITYHTLSDDIKIYIPFSAEEVINSDVDQIVDKLESAGFKSINTHKHEDLELGQSDSIGRIEKIEINGKDDFKRNDLISFDSDIYITFHDYPFKNYFSLPNNLDEFKNVNYSQVLKQLHELGCTNVKNEKVKDITINNESTIEYQSIFEVTINGTDNYSKGDLLPIDSRIIIKYHDYSDEYFTTAPNSAKNYKEKNYLDVEAELHKAGFVNIECKPIRDVKIGLFTEVGEVESVSIDGNTSFKSGDSFAKNVPVVIKYHAKKGD